MQAAVDSNERPREPDDDRPAEEDSAGGETLRRLKRLWGRIDLRPWLTAAGEVAASTYRSSIRLDLPTMAASLSYITLLSMLPIVAVSFVIFDWVGGVERLVNAIQPYLMQYLAQGTGQKVAEAIEEINVAALGAGGFIGLIVACMALFANIETTINKVWQIPVRRSLVRRLSAYWLFLTLGPLVLAIAVGVFTSQTLRLPSVLPRGWWGVPVTVALFYLFYKLVPNRWVHWLAALAGSVFTALLLQVARYVFSIYTYQVGQSTDYYNKVYGGLAVVAILVVWVFIAWMIVLVGACLSRVLQRRLERRQLPAEDFED